MMSRPRMTKKRVGRETNSTWWFHLMVARRVIRPLVRERNDGGAESLGEGVESYVVWPGWERRRGRG